MADHEPRAVLLIGLRASGKSTLGPRVAAELGAAFIDLDDRTPGFLGEASAADALRTHGEPAFRDAEAQALDAALGEPRPVVIALGGGTPTGERSRSVLAAATDTILIYLRLQPESAAERLAGTDLASRPSLTGRGVIEEVNDLFQARDPLYVELADVVIDCDDQSIVQTAGSILGAI